MSHERLKQRIAELLDGSLGLNVFPKSFVPAGRSGQSIFLGKNPYLAGLRMSLLYAFFFCVMPWPLHYGWPSCFSEPSTSLFFLQIYGGLWSGWATTSTRIASAAISKTIERNIIPELSAGVAEAIEQELASRFNIRRLLCVSWAIAILSAASAGLLVYHDVSAQTKPSVCAIVWWSVGWALLFATAAKVVNVSRFYRLFAAHLADDPAKLYAMDPARSTLVTSVASVSRTMLLFWLGIAVSIVLVIPFGVKDWSSWLAKIGSSTMQKLPAALFELEFSHNWFVLFFVPAAGFFSIGLGTVVFLRSEGAIRQAVKNVTSSTLLLIETEVAKLSRRLGELDDASRKRLTELNALHKEVAMAGSYRSVILSGLSVLVPFAIPLISLLVKK
jgi:hypothetical protein